jgi:ferredoxin
MKVTIDAERCTGHGRCYSLTPEVFDSDDEGHGFVIAADVPAELEENARVSVANCPERAISIVD